MSILPLRIFPDPILKQVSKEVDVVDDKTRKFLDDMLETMYNENGVGLAAVQVGVLKRILVMDVEYEVGRCDEDCCNPKNIINKNPFFMINPKIVGKSKSINSYYEGCLSFPEIRSEIKRPKEVEIEYLDYNGEKQLIKADSILSTCVQHEIDHLDGITFVDYLSKMKRQMLLKKMQKFLK